MKKTFSYKECKSYAVICIHKDNDKDFQVIEYFHDQKEASRFANLMNFQNHDDCIYKVAKYD